MFAAHGSRCDIVEFSKVSRPTLDQLADEIKDASTRRADYAISYVPAKCLELECQNCMSGKNAHPNSRITCSDEGKHLSFHKSKKFQGSSRFIIEECGMRRHVRQNISFTKVHELQWFC